MATKGAALAVVDDDETEETAKPNVKIPVTVIDDDGNTLNVDQVEGEPITASKTAAGKVHKRLLSALEAVNEYEEQGEEVYLSFFDVLEQSYHDNIHVHYGFKTWTEYVNENVRLAIPNAEIRRRAAVSLSEKGVSQRAIAKALTTSQATISRDLDGEDTDSDESVTTTGLDGRETKRRGKGKAKEAEDDSDDDVIDAEVIELPKPGKGAYPKRFGEAVVAAVQVSNVIEALTEELPKTAAARKKLVTAHSDALLAVTNSLLDLCEKLGIEVFEEEADEDADEDEDAETEDDEADEDDEAEDEDDEADEETDEADDEDEPF
jgi:hypothetical protein